MLGKDANETNEGWSSRGDGGLTGRLKSMLNDAGEVDASTEPTTTEEGATEAVVESNVRDIIGALQDQIDTLEKENADLKDQKLRAMAEAQNTLRRFRTEAENQRKFAHEGLVRELIPVLDNFDRTLAAIEKGASLEGVIDGVKAIEKQLKKAVESQGVQRIEPHGQMFDPEIHEAVVTHATDEHPEDTILDVIEAGYVLHDRVIRPSRVRVAKKP